MANEPVHLSIVIPAYNERAKVPADIEAASVFLSSNRFAGEIILVDDGSTDGTADAVRAAFEKAPGSGSVIRLERNRGKGYAVRAGIAASRGEYILFADSGVCVPFATALRGLDLLTSGGCDVANGSRHRPDSVIVSGQSLYRRLVSWLFRSMAPLIAGTPRNLTDTQCGFKMYRGAIGRELYAKCVCDKFMFDVEVILLAVKAGYKIAEFPVEWTSDPDSRLHPARGLPGMLRELLVIRRVVGRAKYAGERRT